MNIELDPADLLPTSISQEVKDLAASQARSIIFIKNANQLDDDRLAGLIAHQICMGYFAGSLK